MVEVDRSL